jgi:hypothetical protein
VINKVFPTLRDAWEGAYFGMIEDRPGAIDYYQRNIIHSHNNHIIAKSAIFDFDLGDIGLTPTKWTKFTGQYVDVELLHAWVNNAMNVRSYDALWPFKSVPPNFGGKKAVHQWGSCLLGFSFRRQPRPFTLTLFTRAQSLGFSGVADYALCDFVARRLAERMGVDPSEIRLQIYCPNFIIKLVEVPQYLQRIGRLQEWLDRDDRMGNSIRYYWDYMHRPEEEIKWRAARRMKHKLEQAQNEYLRSYPVVNLTLKGWHAEGRAGVVRTSQQAMQLVLTGRGRRGEAPLVTPEVVDENPVSQEL